MRKGLWNYALLLAALITWAVMPPPSAQAETKKKPVMVQMLFVQNAKSVTFAKGVLALSGIHPSTLFFSDRPQRISGLMPNKEFLALWSDGKDNFSEDPPNAALSVLSGKTVVNVIVVLRNPRLQGDVITYDVKILKGKMPVRGGNSALFIDIIGRPFTPLSIAGVHRRMWRRSVLFGAGPYVHAPYAYGHPTTVVIDRTTTTPQKTTADKLRELQSMLDQRLISKSDFERKKAQLLKDF